MHKNHGGLPVAGSLIVDFYIGQGNEWHNASDFTVEIFSNRPQLKFITTLHALWDNDYILREKWGQVLYFNIIHRCSRM